MSKLTKVALSTKTNYAGHQTKLIYCAFSSLSNSSSFSVIGIDTEADGISRVALSTFNCAYWYTEMCRHTFKLYIQNIFKCKLYSLNSTVLFYRTTCIKYLLIIKQQFVTKVVGNQNYSSISSTIYNCLFLLKWTLYCNIDIIVVYDVHITHTHTTLLICAATEEIMRVITS